MIHYLSLLVEFEVNRLGIEGPETIMISTSFFIYYIKLNYANFILLIFIVCLIFNL